MLSFGWFIFSIIFSVGFSNVNKFSLYSSKLIINNNIPSEITNNDKPLQGMKRSVTTLRGGTLGYAEIVAVKVLVI